MHFRLKLLTHTAVMNAVSECDQLGRDVFLETYGFRPARDFFLLIDGKEYDSKAIAGVACKYIWGEPLSPREFAGGDKTVRPVLESLGFEVRVKRPPVIH